MGQVSEAAVLACSSLVHFFVKDMATKMQMEAKAGVGLTPIELKKSILASEEFDFLHEKVANIDENDTKYHRPGRRGTKRPIKPAKKKPTIKKARPTNAKKNIETTPTTTMYDTEFDSRASNHFKPSDGDTFKHHLALLEVEQDENYDESDDSDE
ncbi:hypothetical protein CCR75_006295 [Bremia lactucae]|uniref:Transcription factor CBF/NF-Y/archaeal histone domain-containing protein n=1 Tax=Bremia lactucae TaxID=4779 RepID=A0A976IG69_BRELC|nr:hypothetical protein CCR75_006295 [Bremia lactucae]